MAEGDFDPKICPGTMHERWTLARAGDGLQGKLVSQWPQPGDCSKECRAVFAIRAAKAAP